MLYIVIINLTKDSSFHEICKSHLLESQIISLASEEMASLIYYDRIDISK